MPHEYRDDEDRPPPYNNALATEQGVNGGGGYNVPLAANQTVRGYKSTVVRLDGHGTAVSVEVGWAHSDDAAGIVTLETKAQPTAVAGTLFFVNQGDILDHVKLTGGGNIDYSVLESNQLPLPVSTPAGLNLPWATSGGTLAASAAANASADSVQLRVKTNDASYYSLVGGQLEVAKPGLYLYHAVVRGTSAAIAQAQEYEMTLNIFTGSFAESHILLGVPTNIVGRRTQTAGTFVWEASSTWYDNIEPAAVPVDLWTSLLTVQAPGAALACVSNISAVRLGDNIVGAIT